MRSKVPGCLLYEHPAERLESVQVRANAGCVRVLEYLDQPYQCLDELERVLEPGGTLIVSGPHSRSLMRRLQKRIVSVFGRPLSWTHYSSFSKFSITPPELEEEVARRNLKLHKIVRFDSVLQDFLHPYFPPSLLFAVAIKGERKGAA